MKSRLLKICVVLLACVMLLPWGIGVTASEGSETGMGISALDTTLTNGYNEAKKYYITHKTFEGYWAVWGGYACLGNQIENGYVYNTTYDDPQHIGARALAVMMMGDDPYNVNGENLIAKIQAKGVTGAFAYPVFNFLALRAAGAELSATDEEAYIDYCCGQLTDTSLGPDIGGWATVALTPYLDDSRYKERINTAITTYTDAAKTSMYGSSMGSHAISTGCVVTALTALTAAGLSGYDVTTDAPWTTMQPLSVMYGALTTGETGVSSYYNNHYYMEFCELYNVLAKDGEPIWLSCGVTKEKLAAKKAAAAAILADEASYPEIGIANLKTAYAAANALTDAEINAAVPAWGKTYYALQHALERCSAKGNPEQMTDIAAGAWYVPAVKTIVEQRIMSGVSSTSFAPEENLTRGMMVRILWNLEGCPAYTIDNPFTDVKSSAWYAGAVLWAKENVITAGKTDTTFCPADLITREELAAFICRYAKKAGISLDGASAVPFADDADISTYAKTNVYTLCNAGIVKGLGDNRFGPKETATRAQAAQIIYKLIAKK